MLGFLDDEQLVDAKTVNFVNWMLGVNLVRLLLVCLNEEVSFPL